MKFKTIVIPFLTLIFISVSTPLVIAQVQSKELLSKFYPNPSVEINTPGFDKTVGFMNSEEMLDFLEALVKKRSDILSIRYSGESILGKKIPVIYLRDVDQNPRIKLWMQGGLHGNEPAGTESILMFINHLVNAQNIDSILKNVSFAFIPMANIDGYEKQKRRNENDADLNRDQVKLEEQESVFLKQAFTDFTPTVALDFHEYRSFRSGLKKFSEEEICIAQDVLFLPSGNLNVSPKLRELSNDMFLSDVKAKLAQHNYTFDNYFLPKTRDDGTNYIDIGGGSPRSSSTSYALTNAVSILFEIRGIGLERDSYKRRVYSGFLIAQSVLETILNNKEKVIEAVEASINETIRREHPIVLISEPCVYQGSVKFISTKERVLRSFEVEVEDEACVKKILSRKRPKAYILLAEQKDIVQKLKVLGLKIDTLKNDKKLKIEVYKVTANKAESANNANIQLQTQKRVFPKGSFLITTAQKNANVLISTLEPEMKNGYYIYNMIKANVNGEIPIYRCVKEPK